VGGQAQRLLGSMCPAPGVQGVPDRRVPPYLKVCCTATNVQAVVTSGGMSLLLTVQRLPHTCSHAMAPCHSAGWLKASCMHKSWLRRRRSWLPWLAMWVAHLHESRQQGQAARPHVCSGSSSNTNGLCVFGWPAGWGWELPHDADP
jgi:hypothetical protein